MPFGNRRRFLQASLATAAALALPQRSSVASGAGSTPQPAVDGGLITDVNVWVGRWPFRRLAADEPAALAALLRQGGVKTAWTGSLEGLLHRDLGAVNARLTEVCRRQGPGLLLPFGTINPTLPDWEEDLRRCHEVHRMPGVRLHPNYHGYRLDDPRVLRLAGLAEERKLVVQVVTQLEDSRTQHDLALVPPVDPSPLTEFAGRFATLSLVLLNFPPNGPLATRLAAGGRIWFETSHQEGLEGLARSLQSVPVDRLLFGSHSPLFVLEANLLKLRESDLTDEQLLAIAAANAGRLARGVF